jgi:3-dehydrosphinganine reductase
MAHNQNHIIITGGSSGIGLALAKLYARQGHKISIIARDSDKLKLAQTQIQTIPAAIEICSADVGDFQSIQHAINTVIQKNGAPHLLICSAGYARPGHFSQLELDVYQKSMTVNYFGTLNTIKAVTPHLDQSMQCRIVLISSAAALLGIYGYSAYAPSKFALIGLAEVLRQEFSSKNTHISIAYPGDTMTPQLEYENQFKPQATRVISKAAGLMSAEKAAEIIAKGIKRRKFAIHFSLELSLLYRFGNLVKPFLNFYFDRKIQKHVKQHEKA